jgi:hypothetical protein
VLIWLTWRWNGMLTLKTVHSESEIFRWGFRPKPMKEFRRYKLAILREGEYINIHLLYCSFRFKNTKNHVSKDTEPTRKITCPAMEVYNTRTPWKIDKSYCLWSKLLSLDVDCEVWMWSGLRNGLVPKWNWQTDRWIGFGIGSSVLDSFLTFIKCASVSVSRLYLPLLLCTTIGRAVKEEASRKGMA